MVKTTKKKITKKNTKKSNDNKKQEKTIIKKENTKTNKTKVIKKAKSKPIEEKDLKLVKKNNEISNKKAIAIIAVIILIIIIIGYILFIPQYKFSFNKNGVNYYSNYYIPTEFENKIANLEKVYISPKLTEKNASPIIVNSMNLWQVVLIMNDINAIQLVKVVDLQGNLVYCNTNFGDPTKNEKISLGECNELLKNNFVINIENGSNKVIINQNSLDIYSGNNTSYYNFEIIKSIFPNAQESLDIVNEKIYSIS